MKRGCVLETGHLHFNDKPENVACYHKRERGKLNNLFYETMLNNLMLDIISRLCNVVWRLVTREPQTALHNA